jgi:exopolysaccharide biosynthesis predicted pyruvyltransferase EpsI
MLVLLVHGFILTSLSKSPCIVIPNTLATNFVEQFNKTSGC